MRIYTYYENISFRNQDSLINLWKLSWEIQGFEAIVLNKQDAETHPKYNSFVSTLQQISMDLMGKSISDYGMSCYARWLAYANQINETKDTKFFVSDYDIINSGVSVETLTEIAKSRDLHFLDHVHVLLMVQQTV